MKRFSLAVIVSIVAFATLAAPQAHAQRSVVLDPKTSVIIQPDQFLAANELSTGVQKAGINAKTTGLNSFAALAPAPTNTPAPKFYITQIKFETTAATSVSGGSILTVGSTGTSASSLLGSTTLSSSPVVGGFESYLPKQTAVALAPGDVPTVTVGTAVTGTAQTIRAHLIGYWAR